MTDRTADDTDEAGPEADAGPARERVVIRDKRKIDVDRPGRRTDDGGRGRADEADAAGDGRRRPSRRRRGRSPSEVPVADAARRPAVAAPSWRRSAPSSTSGSGTCSGCRRSTPTTASGSTATGARCREQATGPVLSALLPILDDLDRAREHGDLVGPFAADGRAAQSRRWASSG